jgi:cell division protein FtsZ
MDEYIKNTTPEASKIIKKVQSIRNIDRGLKTLDDFDEEEFEIPTYIRKQVD